MLFLMAVTMMAIFFGSSSVRMAMGAVGVGVAVCPAPVIEDPDADDVDNEAHY